MKFPFFIAFPVLLLLSCSEFQPEDWDAVFGGLHLSSSSEAQPGSSDAISSNDTPGSSSATKNSSSSKIASSSSDVAPGSSSSVPVSSSSSQPAPSSSSAASSSSALSSSGSLSSSSVVDCSQIENLQTAMENMNENYPKISCSDNRGQNNPQTYDIVKIDTQIWMAENLNYFPGGSTNSWCYEGNNENCDKYGRLYDWATAMALPGTCNAGCNTEINPQHRGICPEGWHLPSREEWQTLVDFAGDSSGTKLKSATGWVNNGLGLIVGTDDYGFNALPGGFREASFRNAGSYGYWWTTGDSNFAYYWVMNSAIPNAGEFSYTKSLSVNSNSRSENNRRVA